MAGESPGKSDQQKSSGEATTADRDPRLVVRRESAAEPAETVQAAGTAAGTAVGAAGEVERQQASATVATANRPEAPEESGNENDGDDEPSRTVPSWAKPEAPEDGTDSDSDADADAVAGMDTDTDTDSDQHADPTAKADVPAKSDVPAKGDVPAKADVPAKGDVPAKADAPPVDQPTTVFRAIKRPPVDQPTTALKVIRPSEATKPEKAAEPGKAGQPGKAEKTEPETNPEKRDQAAAKAGTEPEAKAETPAERTSTFIPLRRDDARPADVLPETAPSVPSVRTPEATPAAPLPALSGGERTRQQPMPPKPPLDLLAELTNTPPPPETPVRTTVRRVKIWTPLVLLLLVIFAVVQAMRPLPAPVLTNTAATGYTFDGEKPSLPWPGEGQGQMAVAGLGPVGEFGERKPVPIASVTKAMTAYIVLQDHPMKAGGDGATISVDATAEKEGGYDESGNESTLNTIKEGDKLSQKDALSAVMIPSANNVARLLARWDAGSEEAFVEKMNATAQRLGMKDTTYTDPSGLKETTVSTAADQVKLGLELVKIPALVDITRLPSWTDPSGKVWRNYNTLVPYDGAIGMKTGSTTKAGGNLLFAARQEVDGTEQYIVGAILGQHKSPIIDTVNAVSKEALLATEKILETNTVVKKGSVVGYVDDGLGGRTPVVTTKDIKVVGWSGLRVELGLGARAGEQIPHSAKAGAVVGELTAGSGPGKVSAPVALQRDLAEPGFGTKLKRVG
ncbi:serine hydrolase [Streptomyces sp. NPDC051569]|uniref:D-alanyl-D-alanine carboxypeptidase family protein n=1 Tax=Streptomyces sp. NPDC051569 TaxID=3365661 RepID=UPI0037A525E2